jgi:hypothetical protein
MLIRPASFIVLATATALFALGGCAQQGAGVGDGGPSDPEVLALSDQLSAAYLARDFDGLRRLLAPGYTGSAPGMIWDVDALATEFPKIQMRDIRRDSYFVRRLAPGTVLLTEDVTLSETYGGQDISGPYRMNTVWVERAGEWLLLFEQELPIAR